MPLQQIPPVISDPASFLAPGQTNPGQIGTMIAWNWFRQWYGNNYREAVFEADTITFDNTPFASF